MSSWLESVLSELNATPPPPLPLQPQPHPKSLRLLPLQISRRSYQADYRARRFPDRRHAQGLQIFAEALACRIYGIPPPNDLLAFADILHMNFYESASYLKFAHFTANQAFLEAFSGRWRVHVIDFGMKQGTQWPALLQALALRPGGPPSFRLTASSADGSDVLQQVSWKLVQLAETIHVDLDFHSILADSVTDLDLNLLLDRSGDEDDEAVAVNAAFELHRLLARPGAAERAMSAVRVARLAIVTVVEQEAGHNSTRFAERFNEALHYYTTMFDSLEAPVAASASSTAAKTRDEALMSEVYLGRQIGNFVACEGEECWNREYFE